MSGATTAVKLSIAATVELLKRYIPARLPVLIVGPPGVGKSDGVAQAAAACGYRLLISHPVVEDPTDAKGLPAAAPDGESARWLPYGILNEALHATEPTLWFIDDLGQAAPATQASYMQLLLARRVGEHYLPDCVTFVAATNRRGDKAGVSGILSPVLSRFATIIEVEPDVDSFVQWGIDNGTLSPTQIAFHRFKRDSLMDEKQTGDMVATACPRTWAFFAKVLALNLPKSIRNEALAGTVGAGKAADYLVFERMANELPSLESIIENPKKAPIPKDMGALYAVVTGLANKADKSNMDNIAVYVERLVDASRGEFAVLLLKDAVRRDRTVSSTRAYVKLVAGPVGDLMGI